MQITLKKNPKYSILKKICFLKNSFWKKGFKSNLEWIKKNVNKNDIHFLIQKRDKLIGYNLLKKRNFIINKTVNSYYYLDTIIIIKKYKNKGLGSMLLTLNKKFSKNTPVVLITKKKNINFYRKNDFSKLNKKNIIIEKKDLRLFTVMIFCKNKKKINSLKKKKLFFKL